MCLLDFFEYHFELMDTIDSMCFNQSQSLVIKKIQSNANLFIYLFLNFILLYFLIQQVRISHPFYSHQCIHVNPNLPIHHTTTTTPHHFPPLGVHMIALYICVPTSALQTDSSVPFF